MAEVVREFWAAFLDSEVEKDGQVKGYRAWWDRADDDLRAALIAAERDCWRRFRGGVALDDAVADTVSEVRSYLRHRKPPRPVRPEYMRYRLALADRVREENLRPFEVAALLEQAMTQHSEILSAELAAYRSMGEVWHEWRGYHFDYAANLPAWLARGEPYRHLWDTSMKPLPKERRPAPANEEYFAAPTGPESA